MKNKFNKEQAIKTGYQYITLIQLNIKKKYLFYANR